MKDIYNFDSHLNLPAGTRTTFPALSIHTEMYNHPDPMRFDPYRFIARRIDNGGSGNSVGAFHVDNKYLSWVHLTTYPSRSTHSYLVVLSKSTSHSLHNDVQQEARLIKAPTYRFGYGKQACPGRFLAIRQVKLFFTKLFHGYDIHWAGKPPKKISLRIRLLKSYLVIYRTFFDVI